MDPYQLQEFGTTAKNQAIWHASVKGLTDHLKKLLEHSTERIDQKFGIEGTTPLHEASNLGRLDILKLLLQYGADPNIQSSPSNVTAIFFVVNSFDQGRFNLERAEQLVINLLQAKNIDVNLKDCAGKKPSDLCKEKAITLKLLLQDGQLSAENANDHVTRLLDRGDNLAKENDLLNAISNYKVADLLLKEFSSATDENLKTRCLGCFQHIKAKEEEHEMLKRRKKAEKNLKKKLSKKAKK